MNQSEKEIVENRIRAVLGAKNIRFGRSVDVIWIALKGTDGRDYALHPWTFFRVCDENRVLVTKFDMYRSLPEYETDADVDDAWDVQGHNYFDDWAKRFKEEYSDTVTVTSITLKENGDLTVSFSNSMVLEILIETTTDCECWRFFEYHGTDRHLVITGKGIRSKEGE